MINIKTLIILSTVAIINIGGCSDLTKEDDMGKKTEKAESYEQLIQESQGIQTQEKNRNPQQAQWEERSYAFEESVYEGSVYDKTYYDYQNFVAGKIMNISFPEVELKEKLEDYFPFAYNNYTYEEGYYYGVVQMFYDNRTIELSEVDLASLFYKQGYTIIFHRANIGDSTTVRFVEVSERDGLSVYPVFNLIQTWDDDSIYLEDITGPQPRRLENFLVVDNEAEPKLIVHSTGVSIDYIAEEELSFWQFKGSYWAMVPMDLEIDSSNAIEHWSDVDEEQAFEPKYYQDGIVYRPSVQYEFILRRQSYFTVRLGKLEEIEKNKSFQLKGVFDLFGRPDECTRASIKYTIK